MAVPQEGNHQLSIIDCQYSGTYQPAMLFLLQIKNSKGLQVWQKDTIV
jgi:hypothetical protein